MWAEIIQRSCGHPSYIFVTHDFINTFQKLDVGELKSPGRDACGKNVDYKYYIFHTAQLIHIMIH